MSLTVTKGANLAATPRLRLPEGSIELLLLDTATRKPIPSAPVTIWVLQGGGGFCAKGATKNWPMKSHASVTSDGSGKISVPQFALGPYPAANRLLVQSAYGHATVTVIGSYANTVIAATPSNITGVSHSSSSFTVSVQDKNFPNAGIDGCPLAVDIESGGGWIALGSSGPWLRQALFRTDGTGAVQITHRFSAREETTHLKVAAYDAPAVAPLTVAADAYRPRLLSFASATRNDHIDPVSTGFLSSTTRLEVNDIRSDVQSNASIPIVRYVDVQARKTAGGAGELVTDPRTGAEAGLTISATQSGLGCNNTLSARADVAGHLRYELSLPDFPDDPVRVLEGDAEQRHAGLAVTTEHPPWYVISSGGGTRDDAYGIEIESISGDFQYVSPRNRATLPLKLKLKVNPPRTAGRMVKKIHLHFKSRATPTNSCVDDPASDPSQIAGWTVARGQTGDEVVMDLDPLSQDLTLAFDAKNTETVVEITAKVTMATQGKGLTWSTNPTPEPTTILVRALFVSARLSFSRKRPATAPPGTPDFIPIDGSAIVPMPVMDLAANALATDPSHEFYVELKMQDQGTAPPDDASLSSSAPAPPATTVTRSGSTPSNPPTLTVYVDGGVASTFVTLRLQPSLHSPAPFVTYRSDPIIAYLESPDVYGMPAFSFPAGKSYVRVAYPYVVQAGWRYISADAYQTPERPSAFLNMEPVASFYPQPTLPKPRIEFPSFAGADDEFFANRSALVTVDPGRRTVTLAVDGVVYDEIADLTNGIGRTDHTVLVNGVQQTIIDFADPPAPLRPYAWHGTFTAKVPLHPGPNLVEVSAKNILGGTTTRLIHAELIDQRNDFAHPNASGMSVKVRVLEDIDATVPLRGVAIAQYRHPKGGVSRVGTVSNIDVQSVGLAPSTVVDDSLRVQLSHIPGVEDIYRSQPFLLVPDSVPQSVVDAARAKHVPLLRHTPGTRIRLRGDLPHPSVAGTIPMQNVVASKQVEVRLLVNRKGAYVIADRLASGDRFTIEARVLAPGAPLQFYELSLGACDRMGQLLDGPDRTLVSVPLAPGPNQGWLRLQSLAASATQPQAGDIIALSRGDDLPAAPDRGVRVAGGGVLQVGTLGVPGVDWHFPVDHDPARQESAGAPIPQDSPRGTSARAGYRGMVVAATGELAFAEHDAALVGRGLHLEFRRSYHSFTDYDGPMGQNWNHVHNTWLRRLDANRYRFVDGDGRVWEFTRTPAGFEPAPGVYARLVEASQRELRLEWPGGLVQVFGSRGGGPAELPANAGDPELLPLIATYDHARNAQRLIHDQAGNLAAADDALGQRLALTYDERQRVVKVADEMGRTWTYAYYDGKTGSGTNGDLLSVTTPAVKVGPGITRTFATGAGAGVFPNGKESTYSYENARSTDAKRHKLKDIQDAKGSAQSLPAPVSTDYDSDGRVAHQLAGVASFGFTYAGGSTTIIDRMGNTKRHDFPGVPTTVASTLCTQFVEVDGRDYATAYEYNSQTEISSVTSPLGAVRKIEYNDGAADPRYRGTVKTVTQLPVSQPVMRPFGSGTVARPTMVVDPTFRQRFSSDLASSSPTSLVWRFEHETRFQSLSVARDPLGLETRYEYDYQDPSTGREDGNLIRLHLPAVAVNVSAGAQQRLQSWTYNNFGQPVAFADENGVVTELHYYAAAQPNSGAMTSAPDQPTGHVARIMEDSAMHVAGAPARSPSLTAAASVTTQLEYDDWGFLSSLTYGGGLRLPGRHTTLVHNELGKLVGRVGPTGLEETFTFDENDLLVARTERVRDLGFPAGVRPTDTTREHRFEWDRLGNMTKAIVDSGGLALTSLMTYDENERITDYLTPVANRAANPDPQRTTHYDYDKRDRLIIETVAPGAPCEERFEYEHDDDGNIIGASSGGVTEEYRYDAWGYQVEVEDGQKNVQRTLRDAVGQECGTVVEGSLDGSLGNTGTVFEQFLFRDEAGRLAARVEKTFRWVGGARQPILDPVGLDRRMMSFEYDAGGNRRRTITPRNLITTAQYRFDGQLASLTNVAGTYSYTFDTLGHVNGRIIPGPAGPITLAQQCDPSGLVVEQHTLGGGSVKRYYDTLGNLRIVEDELGNRTYTEYDGAERPSIVRREMYRGGRATGIGTARNPVVDTLVTTLIRDENGNVLTVQDPDTIATITNTYLPSDRRGTALLPDDSFQSLGRDDNPGSEVYTFDYHPNGLLRGMVKPDSTIIHQTYDGAGRLSTRTVQPAPARGTAKQEFYYDGRGRCVAATDTDAAGKIIRVELHYDSIDNVWEDVQDEPFSGAGSCTVSSSFKWSGDLETVSYQGAPPSGYVFDPLERMATVSGPLSASYKYQGQYLQRRSYGQSGFALDVQHDATGRLLEYTHDEISPAGARVKVVRGERVTTWNEAGFVETVQQLPGNLADTYEYDSAYRITGSFSGADVTQPSKPPTDGTWTVYDRRGNVTQIIAGPVGSNGGTTVGAAQRWAVRTVNGTNEVGQSTELADPRAPINWSAVALGTGKGLMLSAPGTAVATFAYNVWVQLQPSGHPHDDFYRYDKCGNLEADPDRLYEYDAFDRLIAVKPNPTSSTPVTATEYRYDAFGRRLVKGTTRYLYHGDKILEEAAAGGAWRKRYRYCDEGLFGLEIDSAGVTKRYNVHEGRTGGILFLSDPNGNIVETYGYDPFGGPELYDPFGHKQATFAKSVGNPFLAQGQYYDAETGLYRVGFRDYHPALQRMLQRDPMGVNGDLNAYVFANNNLVGFDDPSGTMERQMSRARSVPSGETVDSAGMTKPASVGEASAEGAAEVEAAGEVEGEELIEVVGVETKTVWPDLIELAPEIAAGAAITAGVLATAVMATHHKVLAEKPKQSVAVTEAARTPTRSRSLAKSKKQTLLDPQCFKRVGFALHDGTLEALRGGPGELKAMDERMWRLLRSKSPPHVLIAHHFRRSGGTKELLGVHRLWSREMSCVEKTTNPGNCKRAADTEHRFLWSWYHDFRPGDEVALWGLFPPCKSCQRAMTQAVQWQGISVRYGFDVAEIGPVYFTPEQQFFVELPDGSQLPCTVHPQGRHVSVEFGWRGPGGRSR